MSARIEPKTVYALQPAIPQTLRALGEAAVASGLEKSLIELVKLRASQINGCAYCLHMHGRDARQMGESPERIDVLPAWREAPCFTARERAALAWTEALTLLPSRHVSDADWQAVRAAFSESEVVNLTAAIATINAWNRFGVGLAFTPPMKQA